MANRFISPNQQFIDNSGLPYAGGFLYFYATGTSTPLDTYSDSSLSIANTNPVELNSDGYAGSVFLQNLAYKVVLEDANHVEIWTMDPVYTSDYSTLASFKPWAGNPNGQVAGFAGTQGALPGSSVIWDYVNNILYVATTTGDAVTTVWTAVNASASTPATPAPQGYLTLSNDPSYPILTADAVSATTVYYTPFVGNLVPIYNGSSFSTTNFTQLSLALSASHTANTIYDVFVFNNSGVLTLVTGPSWANSGMGAGDRGTGGGTTQIQRLNGLWVNAVQITGRNGATTYTIPANTATFLGSIYIDSTPGQVTCNLSFGQLRRWGVSNAYNRQPVILKAGDTTSSWSYSTATIRPSNNTSNNSLTVFSCLPEERYFVEFKQYAQGFAPVAPSVTISANIYIALNNAAVGGAGNVGMAGFFQDGATANTAGSQQIGGASTMTASYYAPPSLGINIFYCMEKGIGGNTMTWYGTETGMGLVASWEA